MQTGHQNLRRAHRRCERGIVLLLALMALLLICAVAATLLYMTATESSLVSNQRLTTRAYVAAQGGLEEGRARLAVADPAYIGCPTPVAPATDVPPCTAATRLTIPIPSAVGQVLYLINPNPATEFTLADISNPTSPYFDLEYDREWGAGALAAATKSSKNSDMMALATTIANFPTIPYKWVRITVLTELAAKRDIDGSGGPLNNATVVTWDSGANKMKLGTAPNRLLVYRITTVSLVPMLPPSTGMSSRIVQYDVSGPFAAADFPAAISMVGTGAHCGATNTCNCVPGSKPGTWTCPSPATAVCDAPGTWGPSNALRTRGQDQAPGAPAGAGGPGLGCTDPVTCNDCKNELRSFGRDPNWTGNDGTSNTGTGSIAASLSTDFSTTSGLLNTLATFRGMADAYYAAGDTPPQTDGDPANDTIPWAGGNLGTCDATTNNPRISYFDGDVNLGAMSGCGVLVVTGKLTVSGAPTWKGIILLVGEGAWNSSGGGNGGLEGAMLLARIYCKDGDPAPCPCTVVNANCLGGGVLATPEGADFEFNGGGTSDLNYNSYYIRNALIGNVRYRVLAYREISQ